MESISDLTPELDKLRSKDKFYKVTINLAYLLAPQDKRFAGYFEYTESPWGRIEFRETVREGTEEPEEMRSDRRRVRVRESKGKRKQMTLWRFKEVDGKLYLQWGGRFGVFKQGILWRVLAALKKNLYWSPSFDLMKVYPKWLCLGDAPADWAQTDGQGKIIGGMPEIVMEKRFQTSGRVVRAPVAFEFVRNRTVVSFLRTDGENPSKDQILSILKSFEYLDGWGPSRRGTGRVMSVEEVKPSTEETQQFDERYLSAEPTEPVVY